MTRKEFLTLLGMGALGAAAITALPGCLNSEAGVSNTPTSVDFTISLSSPSYATLAKVGGYAYANGIIIAHLSTGAYVAVSQACTHEGCTVGFNGAQTFICPCHGATYNSSGTVTGGPAPSSLVQYKTSLSGTNLRIYS